jgi:hypothetical protein
MQEASPNPYLLTDPKDVDGIVIHSSDPCMQSAFRKFVELELDMNNPVSAIVPTGMESFVSPMAFKFAGQLLSGVGKLVKETDVSRVILIVSEDDASEVKKVKKWLKIPKGGDVTLHLLGFAKNLVSEKVGIDVETYLAKGEEGEVRFYRIDKA